jgi:hypothetical protein
VRTGSRAEENAAGKRYNIMIYALSRALVCFLLSVLTSTIIIRYMLAGLAREPDSGGDLQPLPSTGFWIGFFETVPTLIFVVEREYTAVALLLAAKLLIGKTLMTGRPTHYVVGTLCNFSVAILFGILARLWMSKFLAILLV